MCKIIEEMLQEEHAEGYAEGRAEMALSLVKAGCISLEALNDFLKSQAEDQMEKLYASRTS